MANSYLIFEKLHSFLISNYLSLVVSSSVKLRWCLTKVNGISFLFHCVLADLLGDSSVDDDARGPPMWQVVRVPKTESQVGTINLEKDLIKVFFFNLLFYIYLIFSNFYYIFPITLITSACCL